MLSQYSTILLLLAGIASPVASQALIDTLVASGASKFATFIQSDPAILALYTSGQVKTVFAPADCATSPSLLRGRALTPSQERQAKIQAAKDEAKTKADSQSVPGATHETLDTTPLLDGKGHPIVADSRPLNSNGTTKRWNFAQGSAVRRESNGTTPSLLRIASGLGDITNVIKADIPWDCGLIQITDKYFTLPQGLSSTAMASGNTMFASLANSTNMTSTLETKHSVTVFLPSNAAFSSTNLTSSAADTLANHVVTGFVGYLPDLKDGSTLTTQKGEVLAISVRDGQWFVNGGRITQANLVLENGVAHVIDKVLAPKKPQTVPPTTGGAVSRVVSLACVLGAFGGTALMALL